MKKEGDVRWDNIEFPAYARRARTVCTYILSALVLTLSCGLVYCMESSQAVPELFGTMALIFFAHIR